jgi:hypothetical protein
MTGRLRNDLERNGRDLIEVQFHNLSGTIDEIRSRITGVPALIRTDHLPNPSRERCRYTNLLDRIFAQLNVYQTTVRRNIFIR